MALKQITKTPTTKQLEKLLNQYNNGLVSARHIDTVVFNRPQWGGKYFTSLLEKKGLV